MARVRNIEVSRQICRCQSLDIYRLRRLIGKVDNSVFGGLRGDRLMTIAVAKKQKIVPERKYFTLAEARRALVLVEKIAADIQRLEAHRRSIIHEIDAAQRQDSPAEEVIAMEQEFDSTTEKLSSLVDELGAIGVELKDPARGLVDFPALFENREILLCWQLGEPSIGYWHETSGGFIGRRSVADLERPRLTR